MKNVHRLMYSDMIVGLMLFTLNRYTSKSITDLTDKNDSKQELSIRTDHW